MKTLLTRVSSTLCALTALAALGAAGCGPSYDHLAFAPTTQPPVPIVLLSTQIQLPEGVAVAFKATPMAGQEKLDKPLILTSSDPTVLGVAKQATSDGGDGFVIFGVGPGKAELDIVVDGDHEPPVPAEVLAPSP